MPEERILIVGGDESARGILAHALGGQGRRLRQADDPTGALRMVDSFMPHLLIADADLPDLGGLDLIERLLRRTPDADAMLMSGGADIRTILRAKEIGALDVLRKPLDHKDIRDRVARGFMSRRIRERCHPTYPTSATDQEPRLIGRSAQMLEVRRQIADFASTNATVLIVGPTGTGKELVARSIHEYSERRNHPFVTVNCAAVNASLTESELFGHAKGAFTGAARDHGGRFEQASGGTILLDEIGDATLEFQAKLLRVLQDGTFDRIGGETELTTNARVIAATNQDLDALTEKGGFRSDLLHRLAVAV
ncbi:MAG: sigma-54 dependent transcriptional regulator, partial [Rhodothermales bacterium]